MKSTKKHITNAESVRLFDKLEQIYTSVTQLDKKVDLHIQSMQYELGQIRTLDAEQNQLLETHHRRSDELARANDLLAAKFAEEDQELAKRIVQLERPRLVITTAFKWIVAICTGLSAIAGLAYIVLRIIGK